MNYVDLSFGTKNLDFGFSDFQELRPSEKVIGPFKIWELSDSGWNYEYHWKKPTLLIKPVGVYKIDDLIVTRPAGMIVNRRLGFDCNTGVVAINSMPQEENLFYISPKNKIIIDEDVIIADGVSLQVFGHWIVDYLPRFGIAKDSLQDQFKQTKILLPISTPDWVLDLLDVACHIDVSNIIKYNPDHDIVLCKHAIVPSYCYTQEFTFHSYLKEFYQSLNTSFQEIEPTRKILISRSSFVNDSRKFANRNIFEQEAVKRGYEIIIPEKMSIVDQIKVFSEAKVVIGEHGSGMHNTVFSRENTIVGCVGFWNAVQLHIGYLMGHKNVYLTRGCSWPTPEQPEHRMDCSEVDIIEFLEKIETLLLEKNEFEDISILIS